MFYSLRPIPSQPNTRNLYVRRLRVSWHILARHGKRRCGELPFVAEGMGDGKLKWFAHHLVPIDAEKHSARDERCSYFTLQAIEGRLQGEYY